MGQPELTTSRIRIVSLYGRILLATGAAMLFNGLFYLPTLPMGQVTYIVNPDEACNSQMVNKIIDILFFSAKREYVTWAIAGLVVAGLGITVLVQVDRRWFFYRKWRIKNTAT